MADIRQPSLEELIRALSIQGANVDTNLIGDRAIKGMELQDTILKNKQAQEDRARKIAAEIDALKKAREQKGKEQKFADTMKGPVVARIGGQDVKAAETQALAPQFPMAPLADAFPKETAEAALKMQIEAAKPNKDNERPDNIKQLFQVGDKVMGVTYGGQVKEIQAPGQLNPLKKTLPADIAVQLGDFDTLSTQLERVKNTNKKDFTGFIQGPLGKLSQKTGVGASPERGDFLSNINSIRNQLIYLRSGKQINEKEYERLLAELPNENASDVDFNAKLKTFETVFNEIKENRRKSLETGFDVPKSNNDGKMDINALGNVLKLPRKKK